MNCAEWQEMIADNETAAVEVHLSVCAECRAYARDLSSLRAELLGLRSVDEAELARIRSNVMSKVASQRRFTPAMLLPFAAAIALVLFGWTMWQPAIMPPPAKVVAIQPPPIAFMPVARTVANPRVARHEAPAPTKEEAPTVVTLFTDDPDVVIVWITD